MREILFRGKAINRENSYYGYRTDYKNGDWVYGIVTKLYNERFETLPAEMTNTNGISGIEVDYKTISQYTGLTDKDGNKIFEGDILREPYYPEKDLIVLWTDGRYQLKKANEPPNYPFEATCCVQDYVGKRKIIGSIYDDPKLAEVYMKIS